ncbi:MAG TPA: glycosyltransferase [Phycisphaerales bacterium]|nr:glycosyltransferase [Phycisphaerales bacterium]
MPAPASRRILVLSASVGAGHIRAAQAMELALKRADPNAHVQNVDVLTLTNALFKRLYGAAYLDLIKKAPHLLGAVYDLTDKPQKTRGTRHALRSLVQKANLKKLTDLLEGPWDVVVNTHFLPADMIATARRRRRLATRQVSVVTDFDAHAFWVNEPCERYYVGAEEAALSLAWWGVERAKITTTGIPVHPVFAQPKTAAGCRAKHGLSIDRPVLLQLAGGFGVGPIESMLRSILGIERPLHAAVVCGRNAELQKKLDAVPVPARHKATIVGFTTEIDELMAAADVVITKPGGLTTAEVLARGCAMVIMNPVPGQEDRNSDYLLEQGAAVKVNTLASLGWKVSTLLADPARLKTLRTNARTIGRPNAAQTIANDVLAAL